MRILTVRQPWAYAIVHLGKDVENRVRNIAGDYRGPVVIHAALAEDSDFALNGRYAAVSEAMEEFAIEYERTRPRLTHDSAPWWRNNGRIIGVVDLVDVHTVHPGLYRHHCEHIPEPTSDAVSGACSSWAEPAGFHLVLANPRALASPIPYKGALGLRRLDDDTVTRVLAELANTTEGNTHE